MSDILAEIMAYKREVVAARKQSAPLSLLEERAEAQDMPRGFHRALLAAQNAGHYGLICEIKKASPSKGLIRADFDPPALAKAYQAGGANCLSVLTDEKYFQGHDDYLRAAHKAVNLPILRKDFMVDPYQIVESRALGADCILLILAGLDQGLADELEAAAFDQGLDALIEVHDQAELERALGMHSPMIGINNRNLKTMQVDVQTTVELAKTLSKDHFLIGESGLHSRKDLDFLATAGVRSFLIGESLMRQQDVTAATRALLDPAA